MAHDANAAQPLADLPPDDFAQKFGGLPTRELVVLVQAATANQRPVDGEHIIRAFFYRYQRVVMKAVVKKLGWSIDDGLRASLVNSTFLEFLSECYQFDANRAGTDSEAEGNLRTWLSQRANWLVLRFIRDRRGDPVQVVDPTDLDAVQPEPPEVEDRPEESELHVRLIEWKNTLPERERDILDAYYNDLHAGQKADRLPSDVIGALEKRYGITASAIRHIKKRLLHQAKVYLSETEANSPHA